MSQPVVIKDGTGGDFRAHVTSIGQLVVAPFAYEETEFQVLDTTATAYNFYPPKTGKQFVITGVRQMRS